MVNKTKHSTTWLFIISAILVAILFNFNFFKTLLELLETQKFSELSKGNFQRLQFGLFITIVHFVIFCLSAFFNYSWKDRLISKRHSKVVRVLTIIAANISIYFVLSYLESMWFNTAFNLKGKKLSLDYFYFSNLPPAGLGISTAYIMVLLGKVRTSALENTRLRAEKTDAELAALKDQISPHFFFNTLSSLSVVVRNEPKEVALEFIRELSNTYRYTLASKQQDMVTLKEELDFVKSYLFLLKKRFGDTLIIHIAIPESAYQTKIPPISLQLLVENAVQHNIMTKAAPLTIRFYMDKHNIVVENNLQEKESTSGMGMGLENLSNRYRLLAHQEILIEKKEGKFRIKLPLL